IGQEASRAWETLTGEDVSNTTTWRAHDFSWLRDSRAHTTVVVGKQITELLYGTPTQICTISAVQLAVVKVSNLSRNFDGVVAGVRRASFPHRPGLPRFARASGAIDSVKKNVMKDPNPCDYDPSKLLCTGGNTNGCLTQAQAETVRKVFQPFNNSQGNLIHPRSVPGGESLATAMYGGSLLFLTADWFRSVVYTKPSSNPATLTLADYEHAIAMNPLRYRHLQRRFLRLLIP
ncbi:hypothetical protein MPER_10309, partial [Moniliophthora perniciosa FA553]